MSLILFAVTGCSVFWRRGCVCFEPKGRCVCNSRECAPDRACLLTPKEMRIVTNPQKALLMRFSAVSMATLVLFSGCSADAAGAEVGYPVVEGVDPRWVVEITARISASESGLERRILEDFYIADAELQEARDAYAACMNERGVEITFYSDGGYSFMPMAGSPIAILAQSDDALGFAALDEVLYECRWTTIGMIDSYSSRNAGKSGKCDPYRTASRML